MSTINRSNLPHPAFGGTVSAITYNQLAMPGKDPVRAPFSIEAAQTLLAGSILGAVTATGELKLSEAAAGDGSEVPVAILAEDLDTTGGAIVFDVFVEGFFNETALVYGTGHDANSVRLPLRNVGIYLQVPRYSYA